jgi:hypothetical protein
MNWDAIGASAEMVAGISDVVYWIGTAQLRENELN